MLTGAAVMPKLVSLGRVGFVSTPYDWVPLAVIMLLIVAIFVRVYVVGDRSRRISHRSRRQTAHRTAHHDGHVSEEGENHGHQAASTHDRTGHGHKKSHHHRGH
jgi:ABC-type nickel/cobalt efflux system permease component RcnA